jgi:hypothetical protein
MQPVSRKEIQKLVDDPISFAMLMSCREIEHVIVEFVSVLNKKKRGG